MKALTTLHQTTPPHITKPDTRPQINRPFHHGRRETLSPPPRTWRLYSGAKGFTGTPKDAEPITRKSNRSSIKREKKYNDDNDDDDKIPDLVWKRMISRIIFYVGVPLAIGFVFLQVFGVAKEQNLWDVPKWLPFLTTFVTFGASALGIAFGSLSTSLDEDEEGSFLGFEQVEKNWGEMWKEEDEK